MPKPAKGGLAQLEAGLAKARQAGRPALIPYVTAGVPSLSALKAMVAGAADGGADVVEVGIPFSDPLADGPVLQRMAEWALHRGFRLVDFWPALAEATDNAPPVVLLTYVNPVLAMGPRPFMQAARAAGATGVIIPDLPWVEAGPVRREAERADLALIPLAAPTSTDAHLAAIRHARGFVYGVSLTGVTGMRDALDPGVVPFAERLRQHVGLPVAIGFGISTPEQAAQVGAVADAVIVGSALMQAVAEQPERAADVVRDLVAKFYEALRGTQGRVNTQRGGMG
jgi:tryptophan synthase alpha chain